MDNPACEECRARKLGCSKARPKCKFCIKNNAQCVYTSRRYRTPLTRAYVTSLERRLKKLERTLHTVRPELDLQKLLTHDDDLLQSQSSFVFPGTETQPDPPESTIDVSQRSHSPEPLPPGPDGLNWGKQGFIVSEDSDSFGLLSADSQGVGYVGRLTNVALLRGLQNSDFILKVACQTPTRIQLAAGCPSDIPWEALQTQQLDSYLANFLIDAYFFHFHTTYPILHEATFRAQFSEVIPRPPDEAWSLLLRTVYVLGAWCIGCRITTGDPNQSSDCLDLFQNIDLLRSGSLAMVQALTLLGCYLHKQNKPNTAAIYLGAAAKMGVSLGLHREFPDWNISILDQQIRRRVWWCLFVFDSGESMALGRPLFLPSPDAIDAKLPLNITEQMVTARTTSLPEELPGPTIYSNLLAQVKFHMLFNSTYNRCLNHRELRVKELLEIDAEMNEWMKSLPPHLQEDHQNLPQTSWLNFAPYHLLWRVRCLRTTLFFPILLKHASRSSMTDSSLLDPDHQEAFRVCVQSAHASIASIASFFSKGASNALRDWYALYLLCQSALVSMLSLQPKFEFLDSHKSMLIADLETARKLLSEITTQGSRAGILSDIIQQFLSSYSPGDDERTAPSFDSDAIQDLWAEPLEFFSEPWMQSPWPDWSGVSLP